MGAAVRARGISAAAAVAVEPELLEYPAGAVGAAVHPPRPCRGSGASS